MRVDADLLLGRQAPEEQGKLGGDAQISRRHARVWRGDDGRLTIEDLGSANGTFVNDERIGSARVLEAGDLIRVGTTVLQVTGGERSKAARTESAVVLTVEGADRRISTDRRTRPRARGERGGEAERRCRALAAPRPGLARGRRANHGRGSRLGQRHVPQRRAGSRPDTTEGRRRDPRGQHGAPAGRGRSGARGAAREGPARAASRPRSAASCPSRAAEPAARAENARPKTARAENAHAAATISAGPGRRRREPRATSRRGIRGMPGRGGHRAR